MKIIFDTTIKKLFSDNSGEYLKLIPHLHSNGITHLTSPPHTPEHNGYVERRHKHFVETGLTLLSHANLLITYWSFSLATSAYLINRLPTLTLDNKSPYFCLFKKLPNHDKLSSFGCLCYPWIKPYTSHKLDSRSKTCIYIEYSSSQSAYYALDPTSNRIYTTRHITFVETIFPYQRLKHTSTSKYVVVVADWFPSSTPIVHQIPISQPTPDPSTPEPSPSNTPPIPSSLTFLNTPHSHYDSPITDSHHNFAHAIAYNLTPTMRTR